MSAERAAILALVAALGALTNELAARGGISSELAETLEAAMRRLDLALDREQP